MVKSHWEDLRDKELRYRDHMWELTGDIDVREIPVSPEHKQ
ncbi:hypothetical protein OB919_05230 [Halobacteria archaeon AArc-curdl1]|uniref:Uncharacterized protein n=1 Tax=Natronosalvus hydrolyticus TaxID=2979988 RepID=A0AAP2Z699_9EURY|nr:hypothetical protein [Halobacteria archaeon AArc-curdl1]